jgi:signal transduction histidine kinase/CheY-like chemotaxis protein
MSDFPDDRRELLVERIEQMAGGDLDLRLPISPAHDHLDAVAHAVNVLVGELQFAVSSLRRAKEEADAANQAKTSFLRNVSHEIRTPLSAILNLSRLALFSGDDVPRKDELLRRIHSNGTALLALVDDLLDLSKLEADRLSFALKSFPLFLAVEEVARDLEATAKAKGLRLLTSTHLKAGSVHADPQRVRQILTNVIGNAIKFTERGEVRVEVFSPDTNGLLAVDVIDSGIGLSIEEAGKLFTPFIQADASISKRFGGSGLGLALARRMAQAMGGDLVLARSAPGEGSTFRLLLPASEDLSIPTRQATPAKGLRRPGLEGVRILVAEDYEDIRLAMVELLKLEGAHVVDVADGLAAVKAGSLEAFDVMLLDVRMPLMDGLEATRQLRTRGIQTPILALTADAVLEHRNECLAAGCDGYLAKPVEMKLLMAEIIRWARPG